MEINFPQDLEPVSTVHRFRGGLRRFSDSVIQQVVASASVAPCAGAEAEACRDDAGALKLKLAAVLFILTAGVAGIALPLLGQKRRFLRTDSGVFVLVKAFAAGVILATGFVHMLPDGQDALSSPCLPARPWSDFPFSSFIAMMAALGTLVLDFLATLFYARKQECLPKAVPNEPHVEVHDVISLASEVEEVVAGGKQDDESMHIVGMYAHAAAHRHSHPHGHDHAPVADEVNGDSSLARHVVISQILELGIVSHSVIIGLSLGVSRSPCTIRPLIGALSFHQFFEGFALGGCISEARFGAGVAGAMACFFAITTPAGIVAGAGLSSFYNPSSPRALVVEGVLDSVSAGILIYMALVDLIGADFLSRRMSCSLRLQVLSYTFLFLGALAMALLALWA